MLTTHFAKAIWKLKILLFDFENVFRSQQLEVFHLGSAKGAASAIHASCLQHPPSDALEVEQMTCSESFQTKFMKLYETLRNFNLTEALQGKEDTRAPGSSVSLRQFTVSSVEGFPVHVPSHDHLQVISLISIHSFRHYSTIFYKFTVFLGGSHQTVEELSWPSKWSTQKFRPAQLPYIQELPD